MSTVPTTIDIQFPRGGFLPAALAGTEKDKPIPPKTVVTVPFAYGTSLIDDKFAVSAAVGEVNDAAAASNTPRNSKRRSVPARATAAKAKKITAAQNELRMAEEALAAETDDAKKVDLAAAVDTARTALEEAQDA